MGQCWGFCALILVLGHWEWERGWSNFRIVTLRPAGSHCLPSLFLCLSCGSRSALNPLGEGHTLRCITSFSSERMEHGIGKKNKNSNFFFQAASKTWEFLFIVEIKGIQGYSLAFSWNRLNFSTQ